MRSADRSCKTSRLTAKEFADAISSHYQTQTISDRQWPLLIRQSHRQRRCASQETSRGYVKLR